MVFVICKIETVSSGGITVVMKGKLISGKLTAAIDLIIIMPGFGILGPDKNAFKSLVGVR